jgi:hypothetical protein
MSDSSAIDQAVIEKLLADAPLRALMPDGVFWDKAGASLLTNGHATRFVFVSFVDERDELMFGGRAYEDGLYLVKASARSDSGGDVRAAAARIDAILHGGDLAIDGYRLMIMQRESRIRLTEDDPGDLSKEWQHRGGRYQVMARAPLVAAGPLPDPILDGGAPDTVFVVTADGGGI